MDIKKEKIHDLVGIFYRNTFKTFYINSTDGVSFVEPFGIFVSLGITTSLYTLEEIKQILIDNGFKARLAEISSKRLISSYLNMLSPEKEIKQYCTTEDDSSLMDREKSEKKLSEIRELITSEQDLQILKEIVPKISRLEELIKKIDSSNSWDLHSIKEIDGNFQLFHRYVNYKREGDLEYRIGIYVSDDSN